ncbi:MAG TPA: hypothetical protein VKX25_11565 [Bryobacteraceae bacterium]|jgi:hypothetical protein|nr:hypothetical protein [Bryobacteraceae bacterium]
MPFGDGISQELEIAHNAGALLLDDARVLGSLRERVIVVFERAFVAANAVLNDIVAVFGPDARFQIDPARVQNAALYADRCGVPRRRLALIS